ncbi:atrazine chlorohydrolase/5-methylthioadenosine/S-adenosylhomocysteine deaminase/melamine deaminase [Actinocorallia herbida]|uniref:Atrazine chlorohydrolase/5-methylthioadenosine/S-adenosylhomocysteine deaminase/melamine deaminase n=1 Tax=Actinocorallia herbida TaxID=58109 RepID=A0A3N1CZJ2_9ACTN|nr:amidohydrolase family protein [Actinocorallia herbida]ROO86656.1 atrazine chlorohydrolase/5-methylthioadenosine/S-adenosylhomocysteine deaminase/melamine deaminase [Actinocorallia herbida]
MSGKAIVGGRVLTMDAERRVLDRGTVLIEDDSIVAVGPADTVAIPPGCEIIDASRSVVMPGLVNAHTHGSPILLRAGGNQDRGLTDWLFNDLYPGLARYTLADLETALRHFVLESLRAGVTTVVLNDHVHPFDPLPAIDAAVRVLSDTGIRAVYARMFTDARRPGSPELMDTIRAREPGVRPASVLRDTDAVLADLAEMYRRHDRAASGRIRVCASPSTASTAGLRALVGSRALAHEHDGIWALHLAETPDDRPVGEMSAVEYLASHHLLDDRLLLGHAVHLGPRDLRLIAAADTRISTQPVSNGVLGSGVAPVPAMLQAAITVGIGTDDANCNDGCDVLADLKTLGVVQRAVNRDAGALTAEELLETATLGGARAAGLEGTVGALVPGLQADVILLDAAAPHLNPAPGLPAMLAWQATGRDVRTVLVAGRVVIRDGVADWLDPAAETSLVDEVNERAARITAEAGIPAVRPWRSRVPRRALAPGKTSSSFGYKIPSSARPES